MPGFRAMNRWTLFLVRMLSQEKRWLTLRLVCSFIWAAELFWVQGLAFDTEPWVRYPLLVQFIRFCLDWVTTLLLSLLLQRRFVTPLLLVNAILLVVVGTYSIYFHRPLMPVGIVFRWHEGCSVRSYLGVMIPLRILAVILVTLSAKFLLLIGSGRGNIPAWARWRMALFAVILYALLVGVLQWTQFKLSATGDMGRAIYAYGYTLPWFFDSLGSLNQGDLAERATAFSERHHHDRLTPMERPLSIGASVLVLQLETIGTRVLDASCVGGAVMPFMQELRRKSLYYRIQSFHSNGSCDMDFAATTFTRPYPCAVPYRLPGMQYTNSIPGFMKQHGYRTYVFHGNTQLFYDRGVMMEQLGFDQIFFKEQLASRHLKTSIMGVRDADLLRCVAEVMGSEKFVYVFAITLDTHAPFNVISESEMDIFPRPESQVEKYLNSARYLDNCLRDLIEKVPVGTTVVLYGDHTASLNTEILRSDVVEGVEYVPCLIYQKGNDLSHFQTTRDQDCSRDGSLDVLDIMGYLRNSVMASDDIRRRGAPPSPR